MEEGDSNSMYFHISTITQHRHNAIDFLVSHSGETIINRESIDKAFVTFYSMLFTVDVIDFSCIPQDLFPPVLSRLDNNMLCSLQDSHEVRSALMSMGSHKSLGTDGFAPLFSKTYWQIVGDQVVKEVQHFFSHGHVLREMNHTFISLIPKMEGATRTAQYRPIGLCNVMIKILMKILATRMRIVLDKLDSSSQATFIPNRSITNNTILNQDHVFHEL